MKQNVAGNFVGWHFFRYTLAITSSLKKTPLSMLHKSDRMFTLAKTVLS